MAKAKRQGVYGSRREQILEAAVRLFRKQGISQTRMSDIAAEAGVQHPVLSYHFPTPESLYEALIHLLITRASENAERSMAACPRSALGALESYVKSYFGWVKDDPHAMSLAIFFYHLACYRPEFRRLNELTRVAGRERIGQILYRAIASGELVSSREFTVEEQAYLIQSELLGGVIMASSESYPGLARAAGLTWRAIRRHLELPPQQVSKV